ncbi:MAG: DUF2339 domain-containing protein, partial [Kibdelosporangium sp.]
PSSRQEPVGQPVPQLEPIDLPSYPGYPTAAPKPAPLYDRLSKDQSGSRVLAWVGGAVTLLGVVLLLILAVQRGWLGPVPRVLGGAALGGALIAVGVRAHRSATGRTGAFALAATGIATLYLDVVAATTLLDLMPPLAGLALGFVVAMGGLLLATRWDSSTLAVAVVVGCAVCAPMITKGFTQELVAFLVVVQVATTPLQLRRNWPVAGFVAGVAPLAASFFSTVERSGDPMVNALTALLAMAVGVALALVAAVRRDDDDLALVLLVMAAGPALFSVSLLQKSEAIAVSGAVAVVMVAVWATSRFWPGRIGAAGGAVALVAIFQTTAIAFDGTARSMILMSEGVLLALLALWLRSRVAMVGAVWFGAVGAVIAVGTDVPIGLLVDEPYALEQGELVTALFSSLLMVAVAVLTPWAATLLGRLKSPANGWFPWAVAGSAALYGAAGVVLSAALLVSPDRSGFLLGHALVTVSWTVAALVLLLRGIQALPVRVTGLVLVGAAVLKLVLFDLSALDGMARVAAFLGAGLILLAAGTRYAKLLAQHG